MRNQPLTKLGLWTGISSSSLDFWMQQLHPTFSIREVLATVQDIEFTCENVKTLTLKPNALWKGFEPGQHVHVSIRVQGAWLRRTWTISSSADDRTLTLTIGKIPHGRVTSFVHEHLSVGTIVKLSHAEGHLVLPEPHKPVVFLAGGVGITPALSMLRTMRDRGDTRRFELVHFIQNDAKSIARAELEAIERELPNVRIHWIQTFDGDPEREQRISSALLSSLELDNGAAQATWMICGPEGFMDAATQILADTRPLVEPKSERFTPPSMKHAGEGGVIHFVSGGDAAVNGPSDTMLSAIEASGRTPKHGCRAGICFQCTCIKKEGTVRDLRTGKLLTEDGESIQICMSQAVGDVTLDL